jgi:hypothetical protein
MEKKRLTQEERNRLFDEFVTILPCIHTGKGGPENRFWEGETFCIHTMDFPTPHIGITNKSNSVLWYGIDDEVGFHQAKSLMLLEERIYPQHYLRLTDFKAHYDRTGSTAYYRPNN